MKSIRSKEKDIVRLCKAKPVTFLGVFGSYARGEQTQASDIDLLIDYTKEMTYFDMCDFREDLEVLLEKRIDLVPHKTLKAIIRDSVYRDLLVIYEK
mgnify:FL=1